MVLHARRFISLFIYIIIVYFSPVGFQRYAR